MVINGIHVDNMFPNKVRFIEFSDHAPAYKRDIMTMDNDYKILGRKRYVGIRNMQIRIAIFALRDEAYKIASLIASQLDEAYVTFDNGSLFYRVSIHEDGTLDLLGTEMMEWVFQLQVLETMLPPRTVTSTTGTLVVDNIEASATTPITIKIIPTANIATFTIYGMDGYTLASPLTVTNLVANKPVTIDGEKKLVLQEESAGVFSNKFSSTNLYYFPSVKRGTWTITYTPKSNVTVEISFKPRMI